MRPIPFEERQRGVALLAVLFALTLLMLLALPFAVSMGVGADAAMREVETAAVQQASASVREVLLNQAAMSHPVLDATPTFDSLAEYPDGVELPAGFDGLRDEGRVLLGGGIFDLQRKLGLDSASPLLFANVLGTATRLSEDLMKGATAMVVEDASRLPDAGYLWIADEVVRYGSKQGNNLLQLERGLFPEGFRERGCRAEQFPDGTQNIGAGVLVLDYRCVLASAWPFFGRGDGTRHAREPYRAVGELAEVATFGLGAFTGDELDALQREFAVDTMAATAATWGRPERVFNDLKAHETRALIVKSALHLGAGATVRLRNLRNGATEYGLLTSTSVPNNPAIDLPSSQVLGLHVPVLQDFPALDTVVEPLIPAPVNVNTASVEALTALCAEVAIGRSLRAPAADGKSSTAPRLVGRNDAVGLAQQIAAMRGGRGNGEGPFTGWRDFVERIWKPRLEAMTSDLEKRAWLLLYRNLRTGRDARTEMGTAPLCFDSGPWVSYRAAASRSRSVVAPGVVGRHERTGIAAAVPGFLLEKRWATQDVFEETFRLDRRAPFWTTTPINVGAIQDGPDDPASRTFPHLAAIAFPGLGFGEPRFPTTDDADAGLTANPASVHAQEWPGAQQFHPSDMMIRSPDRRGHDVSRDGPYTMVNTGPAGSGGGGSGGARSYAPSSGASSNAQRGGGPGQGGSRQQTIEFPFSNGDGFSMPFALSAWIQAKGLDSNILFDHSDGDPDRNRLSVWAREANLVLEVLDEAGIDPNPSDSPAGVERTASEWSLPLAELGLPADVPVHLSFSAYTGRPADLSVAIDGMTRGKVKYRTYLTAALKPFDPTLSNNSGPPGQRGSDRYVDLQVDSTEGFPPVGVLRVGLELFEYSSIQGNTFRGEWKDSLGGRGARQSGMEHFPKIPTDANGNPTVDIDELQQQGVNLAVFPEHPVGTQVELYGYSAVLSEDSPMMVGETKLDNALGAFAVARGFIDNPQVIAVTTQSGGSFEVGKGITDVWTGDLQLGNPDATAGRDLPPPPAQDQIINAFPTSGGYALLLQIYIDADPPLGGGTSVRVGGIEVIRYASRQGNKLASVQRNQRLPGDDGQIDPKRYDGTARHFVTDWRDLVFGPPGSGIFWDDVPGMILWVVPVSIAVQNTQVLWDPDTTTLSEWVQLYPHGGDPADTEWVRYDSIQERRHLCRGNRAAWAATYRELIRTDDDDPIEFGPLGANRSPDLPATAPWGTVTPTSGYIGYTPQLESDYPQIRAVRYTLRFRGDPMQDFYADGNTARGNPNPQATSSHAHTDSVVTQCHRLQLGWGNYSSYTGRCGRNDRVALVQGSQASGSKRPLVEWHTVNWCARRFDDDTPPPGRQVYERLGPDPFQLVAFRAGVQLPTLPPPDGEVILEPRRYDRVVKFPSGELPAAWCEGPTVGGGIAGGIPITGFVDDVEVTNQIVPDVVVDEAFDESAKVFRINTAFRLEASGMVPAGVDVSEAFPKGGGLVLIDGEILAYSQRSAGEFTVATNGRGLLNTEARGHDRGARVHFLTHRPAAILTSGVGSKDSQLPVIDRGALPRNGTLLLGQELLHYTWPRGTTEQVVLEMPTWFPSDGEPVSSQARGLFRGRFGTAAQGGANNEAVILFPFRYWDRHVERSDDPELAYAQLTTNEAPAYFRTLRWREETTDARCEVVCLVRTDGKTPWEAEPAPAAGLWLLKRASAGTSAGTSAQAGSAAAPAHRLGRNASRLEIRFATVYRPGAVDLASFRAHGWKTTARITDVVVEYEGQGRVFDEQVTAR